jgi:hypothetical protein
MQPQLVGPSCGLSKPKDLLFTRRPATVIQRSGAANGRDHGPLPVTAVALWACCCCCCRDFIDNDHVPRRGQARYLIPDRRQKYIVLPRAAALSQSVRSRHVLQGSAQVELGESFLDISSMYSKNMELYNMVDGAGSGNLDYVAMTSWEEHHQDSSCPLSLNGASAAASCAFDGPADSC